ncbi:DUF805 domain-containing protein [uncultured Pelagimonas sp.]|uniref:DUF805 domain-containing protein n=1 Tax=uncultured Pelagimonas sp. TaxID=1618102 RepID=UPI00262A3EA5|nr:DUF805 domain-containing protein [uncultured Pelagimonas sp.]
MIGPHTALENYIFKAFNISGRATRAEYWWVALIMFVFMAIAAVLDIYTITTAHVTNYNPLAYLTPVLLLLTFIPNTTILIRRLHDAGRSGMWYFVNSIPIVGPIWLLVLLILPSEPEENQWGQPPHNPTPTRRTGFDAIKEPAAGPTTAREARAHDARQSYATLLKLDREPSPEEVAAQREQISDYYQTHVLGRASA